MALEHHSLMLLCILYCRLWQVFTPLLPKKGKILMEWLFYSSIVSINDWKYAKSVGTENQVFWADPFSYASSVRSWRI